MKEHRAQKNKFLSDGPRRAAEALAPEIRAEVEAEFERQLRSVPRWRRFWIRCRIEREIRKRLADRAPRGGLY